MFTIGNPMPRIMAGTGIGSWLETVPDTVYRNQYGWLLCRSRGKGNGGRITGSRFYVIARDGSGEPHKMRTKKGCIQYFSNPPAAAMAAVEYANERVKAWSKAKLVSDLEALELQRKSLELEVAHLNKTKAELRSYVGRLNVSKVRTMQPLVAEKKINEDNNIVDVGTISIEELPTGTTDKPTAGEAVVEEDSVLDQALKQLPVFMHRAVTHVIRQTRLH